MSKFIKAQIIIIYLKIDTRMKTFFNFMERVLLYQILIFGSLCKFYNLLKSQKEFIHKLKVLFSDLNLSKNSLSYMSLPENDDTFFRIVLISIITFSVLSILNINFMQLISGIISIIIGFIYFNPFTKINELIAQNSELNVVIFCDEIFSLELLIYICAGIAMINQAFNDFDFLNYIFCCFSGDDNKGVKRKNKRKCRVNFQFEIDLNNNDSNSSENYENNKQNKYIN